METVLYWIYSYFLFKINHCWVKVEMLTFIAAMSLSYDSLIFFIISSSALEHASMEPFTVMVRSGLYRVKSWRLDGTAIRVYNANQTHDTLLKARLWTGLSSLTVKLWSWSPCPVRFSSDCGPPSQSIFLQSCCVQVSSMGSLQCCTRQFTCLHLYFEPSANEWLGIMTRATFPHSGVTEMEFF